MLSAPKYYQPGHKVNFRTEFLTPTRVMERSAVSTLSPATRVQLKTEKYEYKDQ
jgi:hypothetical protein